MSKTSDRYALIRGEVVVELFDSDPNLHSEMEVVRVPAGTQVGWRRQGKSFVPPPLPGAAELRAEASAALAGLVREARVKAAGTRDPIDFAVWAMKAALASDHPAVVAEAKARGLKESPAKLVEKQAAKAQSLAVKLAAIDGERKRFADWIAKAKSAKEFDELLEDARKALEG